MTPAERTYARLPGLSTCQASMHGSGKAAAVNRATPATGVRKQPFIASDSANASRPPTGATGPGRGTAPTQSWTRMEQASPTGRRAWSTREPLSADSDERPRAGARRPTARTLGGQCSAPATQASTTPASQRQPLKLRQLQEADCNNSSFRPTPAGRLRGPSAGQCRRIHGLGRRGPARPERESGPLASYIDSHERPGPGARWQTRAARTLGQESRRPEQRARHPSKHDPGKPAAVF
jgi:hypothetical protein